MGKQSVARRTHMISSPRLQRDQPLYMGPIPRRLMHSQPCNPLEGGVSNVMLASDGWEYMFTVGGINQTTKEINVLPV